MANERQCVLITGAASDIGTAIAADLSAQYDVVLSDIDAEKLEAVRQRCDGSARVEILEMKLDDLDAIESALTSFIEDKELLIDKYVHCAGIAAQMPLRMMKPEHLTLSFNVNVASAALIVKTLVSRKNKKSLNSSVHIASSAAIRGVSAYAAYGSTKAAILGLVRNLAIELAPAVRVNAISPGGIETKATAAIFEERREEMNAKYPLGTGTPDKLVGTVRFLLSDDAGWITGQNIVVDGGRTIDGTD
ncbi:MAG: SDR family NAD(P)-dependent oxidoreductase [Bacillota bacterium]